MPNGIIIKEQFSRLPQSHQFHLTRLPFSPTINFVDVEIGVMLLQVDRDKQIEFGYIARGEQEVADEYFGVLQYLLQIGVILAF